MKRKQGYYWVDYQGEWLICYWKIYSALGYGRWYLVETEKPFEDSDFREIDERKIERQS